MWILMFVPLSPSLIYILLLISFHVKFSFLPHGAFPHNLKLLTDPNLRTKELASDELKSPTEKEKKNGRLRQKKE